MRMSTGADPSPRQNDWGNGFAGAISIKAAAAIATLPMLTKNTGNSPINGWALTWTWSGNRQMIQSWNSNYTQSGETITLTNAARNPTIAPGGTLTGIGFNANYGGNNNLPTVFHLNGVLFQ
jgi:cellulase/cellobiase CelA1